MLLCVPLHLCVPWVSSLALFFPICFILFVFIVSYFIIFLNVSFLTRERERESKKGYGENVGKIWEELGEGKP